MFAHSLEIGATTQLAGGLEYFPMGPEEGRPIFYFHGCPGSALEISWLPSEFLYEASIRLIAVNRPGFGRSDFLAQRTLLDFAHRIADLAAELNITQYDVLGFSAGGPYALACAHANSGQVRSITLLASLAPLEQPGVLTGLPEPNRSFLEQARDAAPALEAQLAPQLVEGRDVLALLETVVAESDLAIFATYPFREHYLPALEQSIRQGIKVIVQDIAIVTSPWGFDTESITTSVNLWQGDKDKNVSTGMYNHFSKNLPNVRHSLLKDEGHYFFVNRYQEILKRIASQ